MAFRRRDHRAALLLRDPAGHHQAGHQRGGSGPRRRGARRARRAQGGRARARAQERRRRSPARPAHRAGRPPRLPTCSRTRSVPTCDRVLVQPMVTDGVEVLIGVVQEPVFGPLVVFGLGGVTRRRPQRPDRGLAPLTGTDAAEMVRDIRSAPLLFGHHGTPPADVAALTDALLRVSRLADDLPEVAELDLNPSLPARTVSAPSMHGCESPRRSRKTLSCGGCADPAPRCCRMPPSRNRRGTGGHLAAAAARLS